MSCAEPTLQKYFVENSENRNFIVLDLSLSILNLDETDVNRANIA
jgi:hypothetical protein